MEKDGLELAARFSLKPNKLEYCGPARSWSVFLDYLQGKENSALVRARLERFYALFPYLELIAEENKISDPLGYDVVEAYWIGNKLLENVSQKALSKMIRTKLAGRGLLPKSFAGKLASNVPEGALPHHSFQVLYVHFITGKLPWTLGNANKCIPKWGKVVSTKENGGESKAVVESVEVAQAGGKYFLKPAREVVESAVCGFETADCRKGAVVATHWGLAVKNLGEGEFSRLKKYTKQTLGALSE